MNPFIMQFSFATIIVPVGVIVSRDSLFSKVMSANLKSKSLVLGTRVWIYED
jgi:hypothetical protein